jgi:hypothetical protein
MEHKNHNQVTAMEALMERNYNRFEAARQLSGWCLHSTVSTIQTKGNVVHREIETLPGFEGNPTNCCRYWITPEHMVDALKLVKFWS